MKKLFRKSKTQATTDGLSGSNNASDGQSQSPSEMFSRKDDNTQEYLPPSPQVLPLNNSNNAQRSRSSTPASEGGNAKQSTPSPEALVPDIDDSAEESSPSYALVHNSNSDAEQSLQVAILDHAISAGVADIQQFYQSDGGGIPQVSMANPTIYDVQGNQIIYNSGNTDTFQRLADCAMLGAAFDSSSRDPPPRCHPGTRESILRSIQERLHDPNQKSQVSWLYGKAGVGKSAIMQTLAEAEAEDTLGASLFFSRPNNRNDPQKVFTTIAYQLALKESAYQQYITQQIAANPTFLDKSVPRQFHDLIVVPLAKRQLLGDSFGRIILIDGLDECKEEQEQCKIIELIHDFNLNHPTVPLRWIIASRPESHLQASFTRFHVSQTYWEQEVPIDSEESVLNIERFLHEEFEKMQLHYPELIPLDQRWPSERQFLTISRAASGLFAFASTVFRMIDNPFHGDPVTQLNRISSVLEGKLREQDDVIDPHEMLDALYDCIMFNLPPQMLKAAMRILGWLIVRADLCIMSPPGTSTLGPLFICNLLGLERPASYGALRRLRSVLHFPEPQLTATYEIQFLHASFSDYLKSKERSDVYSIHTDDMVTYVWCRCIEIIRQRMKDFLAYRSIELSVEPEDWQRPALRRDLFEEAKQLWTAILQQHLGKGKQETSLQLSLPPTELVGRLRTLDFGRLPEFSGNPDMLTYFVAWYKKQVPQNSWNDIVQRMSLATLDRKRLYRSFYHRRWILVEEVNPYSMGSVTFKEYDPFEQTRSNQGLSFENDWEGTEIILRKRCIPMLCALVNLMDDEDAHLIPVTIFGTHPSQCCAWCRVCLDGNKQQLLFFPYCT